MAAWWLLSKLSAKMAYCTSDTLGRLLAIPSHGRIGGGGGIEILGSKYALLGVLIFLARPRASSMELFASDIQLLF